MGQEWRDLFLWHGDAGVLDPHFGGCPCLLQARAH